MLSQGASPSGRGSPSAQLGRELSQGQCTPRGPSPRQRVLSPREMGQLSRGSLPVQMLVRGAEQWGCLVQAADGETPGDHTWPRGLKWTGGHLTDASYPVSSCSCQFPPRGEQGSPGCKCCGWCHMSRGGDWVRSEFQLWPNSSLGAGVEKGEHCRLFLHPGSTHWAQSPAPPEALARGLCPGLPRSGAPVSRRHSQSVTRN